MLLTEGRVAFRWRCHTRQPTEIAIPVRPARYGPPPARRGGPRGAAARGRPSSPGAFTT
uniref:Uncharacterized protein n=1 Tax=Nonomuraea gerenzanensis TaxID=93944 RepID=A0A1M4EHE3_9ACTN|nr:hypothetical protein BN4615_P7509 [Nonomuraea gerenzanensis]